MSQPASTFSAASGDGYELQMGRFSRRLAGKFLDFAGLDDAGQVLDAGCGTGALSAEILRRTTTATVVAVDLSPAYIAYATASTPDGRVSFETGDLTSLAFTDDTFDQVLSQLVLNFVPQTDVAIRELIRVTKPGGKLSAAIWDVRGGLVFNRLFVDTIAMLDPDAVALRRRNLTRPLTRPGELKEAWTREGLVQLRAGEVFTRTDFASFEDYWAPYDGDDGPVQAYLKTVTPELRDRMKEAVRLAYLDGEEDGPRSYVATAWVVSGVKPAQP